MLRNNASYKQARVIVLVKDFQANHKFAGKARGLP
jgi:hypothetical protein